MWMWISVARQTKQTIKKKKIKEEWHEGKRPIQKVDLLMSWEVAAACNL